MLTTHDLNHFGEIAAGEYGDWFTAHLVRLIRKADAHNREKLRMGFPHEVQVVELWERGTRSQWVRFVKECEEKENTDDSFDDGHQGR